MSKKFVIISGKYIIMCQDPKPFKISKIWASIFHEKAENEY